MEKITFLHYPACGTCKKAKQWLEDNQVAYNSRLIVEDNPTEEELKVWIPKSGLPIRKFFNTSGVIYKKLNLKEKLPSMNEEEQIKLLASNGKLIKRPLIVSENLILVGFKPEEWERLR